MEFRLKRLSEYKLPDYTPEEWKAVEERIRQRERERDEKDDCDIMKLYLMLVDAEGEA